MRLYDKKEKRLIYFSKEASPEFWDEHWDNLISKVKYTKNIPKVNSSLIITKKYLPKDSIILEGGCGLAMTSWYLTLLGYKTIALDYADKTVDFLSKKVPQINPMLGDVRNLTLENESVDGYWSFGVIEHFWDGYDEIVQEANRVIKKDGYFFVTFPQMSRLRKLKAYFGFFPSYDSSKEYKDFYQFALDSKKVKLQIENMGFKLDKQIDIGGMKGLKDEIIFIKPILQKIYDSKMIINVILRKSIDILFSWFTGHTIILVFKKVDNIDI